LLGLLLLAIAGALVVTRLVDPAAFKDDIEGAVLETTGMQLSIRGPLALEWFPWLAVSIGTAELTAEPSQAPLVSWKRARIGARLLPMLRGQMQIDRVRVEGLHLQLVRRADGSNNWAALTSRNRATPRDAAPAPDMRIAGLDIRAGTIQYRDLAAKSQYRIEEFELTTSALGVAAAIEMEARGKFNWGDGSAASVQPFALRLTAQESDRQLVLSDVVLSQTAAQLELRVPSLEIESSPARYVAKSWQLVGATADVAGGPFAATLEPNIAFNTPIRVVRVAPRPLLAALKFELPATSDAKALQQLSGSAVLSYGNSRWALQELRVQLDAIQLSGEITGTPLQFKLQADTLQLDGYLPPPDPNRPPFEFPTEALRAFNANGTLAVDELRWRDVVARGAVLRFESQP
jgi:AsmA protein